MDGFSSFPEFLKAVKAAHGGAEPDPRLKPAPESEPLTEEQLQQLERFANELDPPAAPPALLGFPIVFTDKPIGPQGPIVFGEPLV